MRNDEVDDEMSRELNTLAAAYALDAVPDDERLVLEARLSEYPELERDIDDLRAAAALLAEPVIALPPLRLRALVLDQIGSIRQLPPLVAPTVVATTIAETRTAVAAAPIAEATQPTVAGVADLGAYRDRAAHRAGRLAGWRRAIAVGAVAAAVAAGAVVVGYQSIGGSSAPTAGSVLSQPDVRSTSLAVASGRAVVAWSASERKAVVYLNSLASAPTGHTYQLWLIGSKGAVSKGVFDPDGTSTQLTIDGFSEGEAVGVTVEPAGGSKAPTTRPILDVNLT